MAMDGRRQLIVNPPDDDDFARHVERLAPGAQKPHHLQTALRGSYPRAVVHERGLSAEPITVWYVYREGRWIRPRG